MAQQRSMSSTGPRTTPGRRATRARQARPMRAFRSIGFGAALTTLFVAVGSSTSFAQGRVAVLANSNAAVLSTWSSADDLGRESQATRFGMRSAPRLLSAPIGATAAAGLIPTGAAGAGLSSTRSAAYPRDFQALTSRFQDEPAATPSTYFRAKDGVFVAGLLLRAKIDNEDFNGTGGVSGGGSAEIMPTVDDGSGTGWAIGTRTGNRSMEFNYTNVDHDGAHTARAGVVNSTSETYNFDFRYHFNLEQRFQPHVLFGIGIGCLTVEGGSMGLGRTEDATYTGLGVNMGVGAAYHATQSLSFAFDLGYRLQTYASVDGVVDGTLGTSASGSGGFTGFRISYTF